jgi:hypothetical protein
MHKTNQGKRNIVLILFKCKSVSFKVTFFDVEKNGD